MLHIISTVGTSIYSNFISDKNKRPIDDLKLDDLRDKIKSNRESEEEDMEYWLSEGIFENWLKRYRKKKNYWLKASETDVNVEASAEIQSIIKIIEEAKLEKGAKVKLYFVATDTAEGCSAARIVAHFFSSGIYKEGAAAKEVEIEVVGCKLLEENPKTADRIKEMRNYLSADYQSEVDDQAFAVAGLQVKNLKEFQEKGLYNLLEVVGILSEQASSKKDQLVLNISGGYKAMIPVMTVFAQILSVPIKYIYEESDELFTLEQFPIDYDWDLVESATYFLRKEVVNQVLASSDFEKVCSRLLSRYLIRPIGTSNSSQYAITYLGKHIVKGLQNTNKGFVRTAKAGDTVELILHQYFRERQNQNNELVKNIRLNPQPLYQKTKFYWSEDTRKVSFTKGATESMKESVAKDVDIELIEVEDDQFRWIIGEVKALNQFIDLLALRDDLTDEKRIERGKKIAKSYCQYKARILKQIQIFKEKNLTIQLDSRPQHINSLGFLLLAFDVEVRIGTTVLNQGSFYKDAIRAANEKLLELQKDPEILDALDGTHFSVKAIQLNLVVTAKDLKSDIYIDWANFLKLDKWKDGIEWKTIDK